MYCCIFNHAQAIKERMAFPTLFLVLKIGGTSATQPVIVGRGRIGSALQDLHGGDCIMVGRDGVIPEQGNGPIYVCTRNDDLASVIEKTPVPRRKDLVFLQNGMLIPFLQEYGLEKNTQALIYFAVAKKVCIFYIYKMEGYFYR
jgi:hypothetical protein